MYDAERKTRTMFVIGIPHLAALRGTGARPHPDPRFEIDIAMRTERASGAMSGAVRCCSAVLQCGAVESRVVSRWCVLRGAVWRSVA